MPLWAPWIKGGIKIWQTLIKSLLSSPPLWANGRSKLTSTYLLSGYSVSQLCHQLLHLQGHSKLCLSLRSPWRGKGAGRKRQTQESESVMVHLPVSFPFMKRFHVFSAAFSQFQQVTTEAPGQKSLHFFSLSSIQNVIWKQKTHLNFQTIVLYSEIQPGWCNIKCNPLSPVKGYLKGIV